MGSFQENATFQAAAPHASFKREARVADGGEEEEQDSRSQAAVEELNAARGGRIGRRSLAGSSVTDISGNGSINYRRSRQDKIGIDSFWCGAFCMHLPGLSRRPPMQQQSMSLSEPDARASTAGPADMTQASVVSKVASMERLKYSSSSSGIVFDRVGDKEDEQEVSAYFDLPMELLRSSSVDMESPVTAAFVFSRGPDMKKSVLPELPGLDFCFPAPPAFSSPSPPRS